MVLFASYSGAWGGAERVLVDCARELDGEVCLTCPPGPLAERARRAGLRVLERPTGPLTLRGGIRTALRAALGLARHAHDLRDLVLDLEPELLVAWNMRSAIASLALPSSSPPVVFQHHDLLPSGPAARLVRLAAGRARRIIAPSRAVAEDLDPQGGLADRLTVMHPTADPGRFPARPVPVDPPIVLVLGAIVHWKRPDLALEAMARLRRTRPSARLRFVGAPIDEPGERLLEKLRRRAEQPDLAGAVEFAGRVEDPASELAQATCLLHCAEREPFGLAMLEALACGRAAVAPDAAGPREIVDASCGILYPPGDAAAAAAALDRLLADPRLIERMGEAGRDRARREFDPAEGRAAWAAAVDGLRRPQGGHRPDPSSASVVTVTHNSGGFVGAFLSSVARHLPGAPVIVVDCASSDDTREVVGGFPGVELVALPTNVGFGRANNVGMASVRTAVTILLNPDVELLDDSVLDLVDRAMGPAGERRLLAPLLIGLDGRREDSVHPLPGSAADLLRAVLPVTLLPRRLATGLAPWRAVAGRPVGWAVGAALVARTATLRRLGPFTERIFLYGEDLDLGLRATRQGIETWFCPGSRVLHHRGHSTDQAFGGEALDLLASARRDAVEANLGNRGLLVDDAAQALTFLSRAVSKRFLGQGGERERRQFRALVRARRGSALSPRPPAPG